MQLFGSQDIEVACQAGLGGVAELADRLPLTVVWEHHKRLRLFSPASFPAAPLLVLSSPKSVGVLRGTTTGEVAAHAWEEFVLSHHINRSQPRVQCLFMRYLCVP